MSKPIVTGIFEGFRVLMDPDDLSRRPSQIKVYTLSADELKKYREDAKKMSEQEKIVHTKCKMCGVQIDTPAKDAIGKAPIFYCSRCNSLRAGTITPHEAGVKATAPQEVHELVKNVFDGAKEFMGYANIDGVGTKPVYKKRMPAYTSSIAFAPETTTQRLRPTEFVSGRLKFMRYTIHNGIITIIRDNPDNTSRETLKLRETELDTLASDLIALIDTLVMYNTAAKQEAEK